MKELKDYQRTMRMTQTTRNYLEESKGKGLNEKFENLVYNAYIKEKKLLERNEYLEQENNRLAKEISKKHTLLQNKLRQIETNLDKILDI